jgi:branched-chain amino acid aminotransferase
MTAIVYLNGSFLPLDEARIAVTDYGFLFGYSLYETVRTYQGRIFRLEEHLRRLAESCRAVAIQLDTTAAGEAILETVKRNPLENGRMRLTISPGRGSVALDMDSCGQPTMLITVVPYQPYASEVYAGGFKVIISGLRRNSQSVIPSLKASFFMESILAKKEAREQKADDALLLNDQGYLAEASSSNVFVVSRGVVKTPALGSGLLPGVTRQVVLESAGSLSLPCAETQIPAAELRSAEEIFITNSMLEIMPVTRLDESPVGSGQPGNLTVRLIQAYRGLLKRELR